MCLLPRVYFPSTGLDSVRSGLFRDAAHAQVSKRDTQGCGRLCTQVFYPMHLSRTPLLHLVPFLLAFCAPAQNVAALRPPAVPLVVHDPYFSVWSFADTLTAENTKHWTGTDQPLTGLLRIDGQTYRFIGPQPRGAAAVPAMAQTERRVMPTRTIYDFAEAGIQLQLTFLTPALPQDLDVLSRPLTYVIFDAHATDGRQHALMLYFDAGAQLAVNTPEERAVWSRVKAGGIEGLRVGTAEQPVLAKSGDNLRIDWGYAYVAAPAEEHATWHVGPSSARAGFIERGTLPRSDDLDAPATPHARNVPVLAVTFDLGRVGTQPISRHLMLAYDDGFSIEYMYRKLRPYWRRKGMTMAELLQTAEREFPELRQRCERQDAGVARDLDSAGGAKYAALAILAYRQTLGAHKLVADIDGTPLYFSKENFSNGCIDTVDVTYPSSPFFLVFNPALLKAQLTPVFEYAALPRWPWPFAPHDLGTYPLADGQVYGGGERTERNQMPVEESGNLLTLSAAVAKVDGNADFARRWWPLLTKWAEYLREKGMDPENQLSTDDFAGHLAHNTNLSIKAIVALDGYAMMAGMLGQKDVAAQYSALAHEMAAKWVRMAADDSHFRLAFDKPGTWSQKYNLVWDKVLGLHLFPPEVAQKAVAFYLTKQNAYGLPLDNRAAYTKLDWTVWTATLANNRSNFEALVAPAYRFANESPSRVPLTDWYGTIDAKQRGFQARSVVGGVYMPLLADAPLADAWRARAH